MTRLFLTILSIGFTNWAGATVYWPEWASLANQYYQSNQFDSAYAYYFRVVHAEHAPDTVKAGCFKKQGIILYQQEQYEKSVEHFQLAADYFEKGGDVENQRKCISNMANVYVKLKKYKLAKNIYEERLQYAVEHRNLNAQLSTYINMGGFYNITKQYGLSIQHYSKAKELASYLADTFKMKVVLHNISSLYLNQQQPDSALLYLNKTSAYSHNLVLSEATLWNIQELYYQLGNADSAYKYLLLHQVVADSLKSEKIAQTIEQFETEVELEKSKTRLATVLNWALGLGALLIVVLLVWFMEKRHNRKRLQVSKNLTHMFIHQIKAFENEKTEVGSLLHSDILPTLTSVALFIDSGNVELGRKHLEEVKNKLFETYNNQFYSRRFTDKDWLIYTPTNVKHKGKWIEVECDHNPGMYSNEFQIAVLSILEQLLQDGTQKLRVLPDEYGVEINFDNPISFSKNTRALLLFFDCKIQATKLHIPLFENRT
ncbi:MAG: hypothetical protein CL840_05090 [Crocinitomicaceae bacterium]|nr:hypothetical protein [Crocinitomicaceae bacterium]|tara:strand:- start:983 stop:2440 length:1458 start_codon:yes stop_codon:yes gene_type:complete